MLREEFKEVLLKKVDDTNKPVSMQMQPIWGYQCRLNAEATHIQPVHIADVGVIISNHNNGMEDLTPVTVDDIINSLNFESEEKFDVVFEIWGWDKHTKTNKVLISTSPAVHKVGVFETDDGVIILIKGVSF